MRLIACYFSVGKANYEQWVRSQHTGAWLAVHLKDVLGCFGLTDGGVLTIATDNASSNYSMTRELHSTLQVSAIDWPALRNYIPRMAHVIQLALGAFISSQCGNGLTKSWKADEPDQQFGENERLEIRKSQRLQKEGNTITNTVSAMRPDLAKIIEKVCISSYFESPETDLHIPETACSIDYADTWSSKCIPSGSIVKVPIVALPL